MINFSDRTDADWCFSLFRTDEAGRYLGMNISLDGEITSLQPDSSSLERLANGGVSLVNPRALSSTPFFLGARVSLEEEIFPAAMALGQRFFGKEFRNTFIDIGVPDDYRRASTVLVK